MIAPAERGRFAVLASLLFLNGVVMESNDVVATSAFVSEIGTDQILWVWAFNMVVIMLATAAYSLKVDRTDRSDLVFRLVCGFGIVYFLIYGLHALGVPGWFSYPALMIIAEQQWFLAPLAVWALASDAFSTSEAKRLFPLLGVAALLGGVAGNGLAGASAWALTGVSNGSLNLLLVNGAILFGMAAILKCSLRRIEIVARKSSRKETVRDTLNEGFAFIREVPIFRYLALCMLLAGVSLNAIEFELLATAANVYADDSGLQAFYGLFRAGRTALLLVVQGFLSARILKRVGFELIFVFLPIALVLGLGAALVWPTLGAVALGSSLVRITLQGIDDPARRSFIGLVPDERRGRVGAFLDGYPFPIGSLIGCALIGAALMGVERHWFSADLGRALYLGVSALCAVAALGLTALFHARYDSSLLNWRLQRRRNRSILDQIEF